MACSDENQPNWWPVADFLQLKFEDGNVINVNMQVHYRLEEYCKQNHRLHIVLQMLEHIYNNYLKSYSTRYMLTQPGYSKKI